MSPTRPTPFRSSTPSRQAPTHHKIYARAAWKRFRTWRLSVSPFCEACQRQGRTTPAVDVHHLVPLRDDLTQAFSVAATECLCRSCHSSETRSGR
jgi:5-methylcytosine-specific restriction protein A